jgi:hypothetical protein
MVFRRDVLGRYTRGDRPHTRSFFYGKGSLDVVSGKKQDLGFREERPEIQLLIVPWSKRQADEAKAKYAKLPRIVRDWVLRKYLTPSPNYLVTVRRPEPPATME